MNRRISIISVVCCLVLALSAVSATAQSPAAGGYRSFHPVHRPTSQTGTTPDASTSPDGSTASSNQTRTVASPNRLPFTGVDVRLIVLGGIVLLASGYGLRRGSRPRSD